jgi:chromosome segregation ATPase
MANRRVNINIVTTANTTGATQAAAAMDKLATASNSATTAAATTGKASSRVGQLVGQAGYQVQDFAVQVGAGTSALTAFSQQAPQLLGAFGPAGAVAGAFVAIGAIATKVFLGMNNDAQSAEEKAKNLAEAIEEIGKAAEKAVQDRIDFGKQKIEDATTAAQQYSDELNNAAQNQLSLNQAVLDSLQEINEAERTLEGIRGNATDALAAQSQQATADADRRAAEVQLLIAAEEQKLKAAAQAVQIAKEELVAKEQLKASNETILKNEQAALRIAEERLKTLEKQAQKSIGSQILDVATFAAFDGSKGPDQQAAAQKQLEGGQLQKDIAQLKASVEKISEAASATGELTNEANEAARQLQAAESALTQAQDDVRTSVEKINLGAVSEDVSQTADQLEERAKLLADEVKSITEGVTTSTQAEARALQTINKSLADGKIDLAEIDRTGSSLTELGPRIRDAIGGNTQKVSQLVTIMNEFKAQNDQLQSRIDRLQNQMRTTLPAR